jgi:hypothetical protein
VSTHIEEMTEEQLSRSIAIQLVELKHEQSVLEQFGRMIMRGESVDWQEVRDCTLTLCKNHEDFEKSLERLEELSGQSSEEQGDQEAGAGSEGFAPE